MQDTGEDAVTCVNVVRQDVAPACAWVSGGQKDIPNHDTNSVANLFENVDWYVFVKELLLGNTVDGRWINHETILYNVIYWKLMQYIKFYNLI